ETALLGTPMVVCYRLSLVSELMVRLLIRVPWVSLANLTLGRAVVPELYRRTTTSARLAREALSLLTDAAARETQRAAFSELVGRATAHLLRLARPNPHGALAQRPSAPERRRARGQRAGEPLTRRRPHRGLCRSLRPRGCPRLVVAGRGGSAASSRDGLARR